MIQNENATTGGNTTWATNTYTLCTNRLPCGICRLMQVICPLNVKSYDVTWNVPHEVTCKETGNLTTTLQSLSNTEVQS